MSRPWTVLILLSVAEFLGLALWFSASAVLPALTREWALTDAGRAWMTMAVQLGFVAGAVGSALLNLPDILSARALFAGSALAGAAALAPTVIREGPYSAPSPPFQWRYALRIWRDPALRLANFGTRLQARLSLQVSAVRRSHGGPAEGGMGRARPARRHGETDCPTRTRRRRAGGGGDVADASGAPREEPMKITTVDRAQAHPVARPDYFQGTVHMQELYQPDRDGEESELVAVFFEAGARTRPHTHESAQVLQVLSGRCVVVTETERQSVEAGHFAIVPRGIWHWHGATAEAPMCHISIKLPGRTDWEVPVRDWDGG